MSTTLLSHARDTGTQPMQEERLDQSPFGAPPGSPSETHGDWLAALGRASRILRKRPLWVLLGLLLGLLTGVVLVRREPVLYQATARILVSGSASSRLRFRSNPLHRTAEVQVADQVIRIKDDAVLNQLIGDLDLMNDSRGVHAPPAARAALLRQLRAAIAVHIVPDTRIVTISFSSVDPRFAARLVNTLVTDFSQRLYEEHFNSAQRAMQLPAAQLEQLKAEVQATQVEMNRVQQRLGNTGFASEYSREDKTLDQLTRQAVEARTGSSQLEDQLSRVLALDPAAQQAALDSFPEPPTSSRENAKNASDAQAGNGRLQLAEARASLAAVAPVLGANNPERRALEAEVEALASAAAADRTRRLEQLRARVLLARRNAQAADAILAGALARAYGEGGDTLLYRKLLREFTFTRALYVGLYTRLRTAGINAGLASVQIQLVDAAAVPGRPLPSESWLVLLESTLGGLLAGCVAALAVQNFRSGLRTVDEVEAVTDLPSLATLPHLKLSSGVAFDRMSTARRNLAALDQPSSPFAEGLRNLRLNLDLSGPGAEPRYILFTSSTPSEGKTTVAGNYAVVLAERGERVLLIDADMHRPNLHHRFGLSGRRGLSTALSGQCPWREAVQPVPEVPHLDLLVAGPVPPSPAALLSGPQLLSLLRQAGQVYGHIVLDSPPVMAVNDGIMLSQLVDAVVFVVRHGKIDKRIIRLSRERLSRSGAPMAGTVLNGLVHADDVHAGSIL